MSSSQRYIQEAMKNVESYLAERGLSLPAKANTPLMSNYCPELDVSPELDHDRANYFMSLIGILRWCCEIGRIDITWPNGYHLQDLNAVVAYGLLAQRGASNTIILHVCLSEEEARLKNSI